MIPQTYIKQLLEKSDIVELIGAEIELTKDGKNYFGACPFHRSKDIANAGRQFSVAPAKDFYYCFGCGAHGSVINFFMVFKGLKFVEAIELLATKVGLPAPTVIPHRAKNNEETAAITSSLGKAHLYYKNELKTASHAILFLKKFKISGKTASKFQIGYAPDGWNNLKTVFMNEYPEKSIECGITISKDNGKIYDKFRDRIIFPLFGLKGNLSGFVGRVIDSGKTPIYLRNSAHHATSPASEIFGFVQAEKEIHIRKHVLVVQGCLEVLILHEHGIRNSVSTPGELKFRVKSDYIEQLFRKTKLILFCFANTESGNLAAWQTMEGALPVITDDKAIRFVVLPEGEGPSSVLAKDDGENEFRMLQRTAIPLSEFLLRRMTERHNVRSIEGRAAMMAEATELLNEIKAPHMKELLQEKIRELYRNDLGLLNSVEEHDNWLDRVITTARKELIIVSPWITRQGIERFSLCDKIASATRRGVATTIYTDVELNQDRKNSSSGDLFADGSYDALTSVGAEIKFVTSLHSKMVICDTNLLCVGSFNWLSAAKTGRFKRHELSIVHGDGGVAKEKLTFLDGMASRASKYA
jgi:DNA primase